jgi:hypothetical protein
MLALLAINYSDRYIPAISEWYMEMAVPSGADPALQLIANPSLRLIANPSSRAGAERGDDEPYFVCARYVARRIGGEDSITTFPAVTESSTVRLADGRYTISAHVDQSMEQGGEVRRRFDCTVRMENGGWRVDRLEVWRVAPDGAPLAPEAPAGPGAPDAGAVS